jgi:short subunit dehydrogenase-like uncharacterized protein
VSDRPHDVVLFGATGFTGALTAEYLVANAGEARVALAGRDREKLEKLDTGLPLLHADAEDPGSLREMAESARVVITTVGPYIKYGEPLVAACAEAGTDYVDLTGEPEFVDRMYIRHDAMAQETGAPGSSTAAASTRSRTTSASTSRCSSCRRGRRSRWRASCGAELAPRATKPGEGPSPEERAKAWFKVRFKGEGGGRWVATEVSGGDPGYGETAKMLAESALCLAHDELPPTAGQVTTAVAMGDALIERLRSAGIAFEVLDKS